MAHNEDETSQRMTISNIAITDLGQKYRCKADFMSDSTTHFNGNIYCIRHQQL